VAAAVARYGEGLAAILVEPVAGNMGVVPPERGFLVALRRLCDASGALLVFDEVITGFRIARGGAQERFGISPDLTIMSKRVGGMATRVMTDDSVRNFDDAETCDTDRYAALFRHLLARGVYIPPSQFEAMFVSLAHGEEEIDRTIEAVGDFDR